MVGARTLSIMDDLDLHLQGHDLDLKGQNTLTFKVITSCFRDNLGTIQATFLIFTQDMQHGKDKYLIYYV